MQVTACKNCGKGFTGNFCNYCGEKFYTDNDKKISHFFSEGFHFLTHFEGKFFTTLKTILLHPGKLSVEYASGLRKKYFKPISFFFLLVILYLLFPFFEGLNMQMKYFTEMNFFGNTAGDMIQQKLGTRQIEYEELSKRFHETGSKTSKILLVLLIPITAIVLALFGHKRRKFAFDHLLLATEINSFYILWGYLILPFLFIAAHFILSFFSNLNLNISENVSGMLIMLPLLGFTIIAVKRFYGFSTLISLLLSLVFCIAHIFIVMYVYKIILFLAIMIQI